MTDDLDEVLRRELLLLSPIVRADADAVRALLHPDFVEYGASGRIWDRTSVVAATCGPRAEARDLVPRRVGPDAVLLTYRSSAGARQALRSSLWVRDDAGTWLLLFHQGTPTGN